MSDSASSSASPSSSAPDALPPFQRARHIAYFSRFLNDLPEELESLDPNRLTILMFCVCGLKLLDALTPEMTSRIVEWVYSCLVMQSGPESIKNGFRAGPFLLLTPPGEPLPPGDVGGHLAMTYSALCILAICQDPMARLDKEALCRAIAAKQGADGSFGAHEGSGERDIRFTYCACAALTLLGDRGCHSLNRTSAISFILSCRSGYEAAFGQCPGAEAHGGSTYCAIASLRLLTNTNNNNIIDSRAAFSSVLSVAAEQQLVEWCLRRQHVCEVEGGAVLTGGGFAGRPCKDEDTCYSFWIGATLSMLQDNALKYAHTQGAARFSLLLQTVFGGIRKAPEHMADPLHAYLAMAGLSLLQECSKIVDEGNSSAKSSDELMEFGLLPLDPLLNIPVPIASLYHQSQ